MSRFTIKFSDNIPLNKHSCAHQTCTYKMLAKLNPGARICKKNASSSSLSALSRSLITHGPCKRVACCGEFGQSGLGACGVRIPLRRPAGDRADFWLKLASGVDARGRRLLATPICGAARWVCKLAESDVEGCAAPGVTLDQPPHPQNRHPDPSAPVRQHLPSPRQHQRLTTPPARLRLQSQLITEFKRELNHG